MVNDARAIANLMNGVLSARSVDNLHVCALRGKDDRQQLAAAEARCR